MIPIEITATECWDYNGTNLPLCDHELDSDPWWLMVMAMVLTAVFLQKDYLLCIGIWFFEGDYIKKCGQFNMCGGSVCNSFMFNCGV